MVTCCTVLLAIATILGQYSAKRTSHPRDSAPFSVCDELTLGSMDVASSMRMHGDATGRANLECKMIFFPNFTTSTPEDATRYLAAPTCRLQPLPGRKPEACAESCLAQPFCTAATFFGNSEASPPALRSVCMGRVAGTPVVFNAHAGAQVAQKVCRVPGCDLQRRLDRACEEHARSTARCAGHTFARNRRHLPGRMRGYNMFHVSHAHAL